MRAAARPLTLLAGASVPVYLMAEQEFCELKVDLELRNPDLARRLERQSPQIQEAVAVLDAAKSVGKEVHRAISASAVPISTDDIQRLARSGQPFTLVESSLRGTYGSLPLIGRPDAVHFDGKGTTWIVEYKTRERAHITPSDDAQLRLYGYLLSQHKALSVASVLLVCAFITRRTRERLTTLDERALAGLARNLARRPEGLEPRHKVWTTGRMPGISEPVRWATFAYDAGKVRSELRFLSGYWLGNRPAIPTTQPRKCEACRVNAAGLCRMAQADFAGPSGAK